MLSQFPYSLTDICRMRQFFFLLPSNHFIERFRNVNHYETVARTLFWLLARGKCNGELWFTRICFSSLVWNFVMFDLMSQIHACPMLSFSDQINHILTLSLSDLTAHVLQSHKLLLKAVFKPPKCLSYWLYRAHKEYLFPVTPSGYNVLLCWITLDVIWTYYTCNQKTRPVVYSHAADSECKLIKYMTLLWINQWFLDVLACEPL